MGPKIFRQRAQVWQKFAIRTLIMRIFLSSLLMSGVMVGVGSAQNVSINTTGSPAHASALLEVGQGNPDTGGDNRGLLIPRVALASSTDVATVPAPSKALLVWNTGSGGLSPEGFYYWDGTQWVRLGTSTTPPAANTRKNANCYTCDGF